MRLVVLGSGTSVPHPRRASAAFWLETDGGSVLLDCSADATHRMAQEKVDWANLDAIWISHLHLDHSGGLASLLFGLKWAPGQTRTKPLTIFGCSGIANLLTAIDQSNNFQLFEQRFQIDFRELTGGSDFSIVPGLVGRTFSTPHTSESLALRVTDHSGLKLVYTSDTGFSDELAEFAYGVDLLVMECSFWRDKLTSNHLNLAEAMRIAKMAEPRKLLVTHLYPEWDEIDLEAKARALWPGETIAARDGLRLEI